jgi:cytochrome c oxidase cbb3-type subunit 4
MDHGTLSGVLTALLILIFIGIVVWAWSERSARTFEEAARLPLETDELSARTERRP